MIETWLPIPGFEGFYEVSDLGRVRSLDRVVGARYGRQRVAGLLKKPSPRNGYLYVYLRADAVKAMAVHRLVLLAFKPRADAKLMQVNHIDGVKANNALANLEWVTPSENAHHSFHVLGNRHVQGLSKFGAQNAIAKAVVRTAPDGATEHFPSIADAVRAGYRAACICEVCRGKQKTHAGSRWAYA